MKKTESSWFRMQKIVDIEEKVNSYEILAPYSEDFSQKTPLERILLDKTMIQKAVYFLEKNPGVTFTINLFPDSLEDPFILVFLKAISPELRERIIFEVLEGTPPDKISQIQEIQKNGFQIALDDYSGEDSSRSENNGHLLLPLLLDNEKGIVLKIDVLQCHIKDLRLEIQTVLEKGGSIVFEKIENKQMYQEIFNFLREKFKKFLVDVYRERILFQGYYLGMPDFLENVFPSCLKKIPPFGGKI